MALLTHPKCQKQYPGNNTHGHCSACHETFVGIVSFDAHRVGENADTRRCEIQPYETPTDRGVRYGHWADDKGYLHYGRKLSQDEKDKLWGTQ